MLRHTVAILALGLSLSLAHAYPISPVPLWELVDRADLIVLAEVGPTSSEPRDDEESPWNSDVASLGVIEVWKGRASPRLRVRYTRGLVCPAPPRYLEDEIVVAFLERDEDSGNLVTVGLSYGTLYPGPEGVDDFRQLVLSVTELQSEDGVTEHDRLAWLVDAASRPATRWHGLYELQPAGDEIHSYYDRTGRRPARETLTNEQVAQVLDAFTADPSCDIAASMILRFAGDRHSPELDAAVASAISHHIDSVGPAYWMPSAIEMLARRQGKEPDWDTEGWLESDDITALWTRWRVLLELPETQATPTCPPLLVRGTGATTPP